MTRITYTLTRENLEKGRRGDPAGCPIALSLRDKHPATSIEVGSTYCCIDDVYWRLPMFVQEFIRLWDRGTLRPTTPTFEFHLLDPEPER